MGANKRQTDEKFENFWKLKMNQNWDETMFSDSFCNLYVFKCGWTRWDEHGFSVDVNDENHVTDLRWTLQVYNYLLDLYLFVWIVF